MQQEPNATCMKSEMESASQNCLCAAGPPLAPGALKGPQPQQAFSSAENMQQMKKLMEQELRSDKYKSNSKGYVFTLMPLYAIGVGIFAAYKFLKVSAFPQENDLIKLLQVPLKVLQGYLKCADNNVYLVSHTFSEA